MGNIINPHNKHLKYFSWAVFSSNPHHVQTSRRNRKDEQIREQWRKGTHIDVGVEELRPGVTGQHVDDDHLSPLLHVNQQVAQLPVVLVDQVDTLRTNLLKGHNDAAGHQLQHIFGETTGIVRRTLLVML